MLQNTTSLRKVTIGKVTFSFVRLPLVTIALEADGDETSGRRGGGVMILVHRKYRAGEFGGFSIANKAIEQCIMELFTLGNRGAALLITLELFTSEYLFRQD